MHLTIFRGLPGAGKSTLAHKFALKTGTMIIEPDQFLVQNGQYNHSPDRCKDAHAISQSMLERLSTWNIDVIYVATMPKIQNVFEIVDRCKNADSITVIDCIIDIETSKNRNIHSVPADRIEKMALMWEPIGSDLRTKKFNILTTTEIERNII